MAPRLPLTIVSVLLLAACVALDRRGEAASETPAYTTAPGNSQDEATLPLPRVPRATLARSAGASLEATASRMTPTLSADAAALVGEQLALQALTREADLKLTPEEWSTLAEVTLDFMAVRQAYEATLARATVVGNGVYRLEIPAYPVAGDALREKFYGELREKLGETTSEQIASQLGAALEGRFAGFGVSVQTLDFAADPSGAESDYQVTRTIRFWNGVEASNRLTTRQETHFPGLEDPSGHTWGPFLSVLATQLAAKTGSHRH